MSLKQHPHRILVSILFLIVLGSILFMVLRSTDEVSGRLLPFHLRGEIVWKTITEDRVHQGVSVPAHVNVIFTIPEFIPEGKIDRRTLFGRTGKEVRYWGYCFPDNYDRALALNRRGFPGLLFLSEAEREQRLSDMQRTIRDHFSPFEKMTEGRLNLTERTQGRIRHQKEIFYPGDTCYLMTEKVLPMGTDNDDDGANTSIERGWNTDPNVEDTDADGIGDGLEIFSLGTQPTVRDSDGDGLIDGIEDRNRNGRINAGETNPTSWDSDNDGLCDGLCKVRNEQQLQGEDKNLNGEVDEGETDPLNPDTDGDGIYDEQEYFNCLLAGGTEC